MPRQEEARDLHIAAEAHHAALAGGSHGHVSRAVPVEGTVLETRGGAHLKPKQVRVCVLSLFVLCRLRLCVQVEKHFDNFRQRHLAGIQRPKGRPSSSAPIPTIVDNEIALVWPDTGLVEKQGTKVVEDTDSD